MNSNTAYGLSLSGGIIQTNSELNNTEHIISNGQLDIGTFGASVIASSGKVNLGMAGSLIGVSGSIGYKGNVAGKEVAGMLGGSLTLGGGYEISLDFSGIKNGNFHAVFDVGFLFKGRIEVDVKNK